MKNPSPAFQFYPKDFLSDSNVAAMTTEAVGAYTLLLCYLWQDGSLPADSTRLAVLARCQPSAWDLLWQQLAPCFQKRGNRLINPRLEREMEAQKAYRERKSKAGAAGGKAKAKKALRSTATVLPIDNDSNGLAKPSSPSPSPSPSPITESIRQAGGDEPPPTEREHVLHPTRKKNPLVGDRRQALEREGLELVRRIAAATNQDPEDVMARASIGDGRYRGPRKAGFANMTDDRLLLTLTDLREAWAKVRPPEEEGDAPLTAVELWFREKGIPDTSALARRFIEWAAPGKPTPEAWRRYMSAERVPDALSWGVVNMAVYHAAKALSPA